MNNDFGDTEQSLFARFLPSSVVCRLLLYKL